jgi:hypothetical protein
MGSGWPFQAAGGIPATSGWLAAVRRDRIFCDGSKGEAAHSVNQALAEARLILEQSQVARFDPRLPACEQNLLLFASRP